MPDQHHPASLSPPIGVSCVMPVLNDASHVRAAVESILEQEYDGPVEVLIALGPSIDGTTELVEDLASRVGLSVSRFKARFKETVGVPPADYMSRQKVAKAMDLLRKTGMPVTQIATSLGYASSQYFATAFRRYTGKTPSHARREAYN